MTPEFVAILGVGAVLLTIQVASTPWLANVIHSTFDALRADIRNEVPWRWRRPRRFADQCLSSDSLT